MIAENCLQKIAYQKKSINNNNKLVLNFKYDSDDKYIEATSLDKILQLMCFELTHLDKMREILCFSMQNFLLPRQFYHYCRPTYD